MPYVQSLAVRFDDVDFAQIVYFPRLFGYCHWVFEDFFGACAGTTYAKLLSERRIGFPTVHAEADFRSPLRFGDVCRVELRTLRIGPRSLTNRYRLYKGDSDELCAEIQLVHVATDLDRMSSVEVPADVRAAFSDRAGQ